MTFCFKVHFHDELFANFSKFCELLMSSTVSSSTSHAFCEQNFCDQKLIHKTFRPWKFGGYRLVIVIQIRFVYICTYINYICKGALNVYWYWFFICATIDIISTSTYMWAVQWWSVCTYMYNVNSLNMFWYKPLTDSSHWAWNMLKPLGTRPLCSARNCDVENVLLSNLPVWNEHKSLMIILLECINVI